MRTFLTAILLACTVALLEGCASSAERLADKCYFHKGKASVEVSGESSYRVECK